MRNILLITLFFFLVGCGVSFVLTIPSEQNELPAVDPSKAQVVFMRPKKGGFGMDIYSAQVFDITNGKEEVIGSLAPKTKFVFDFEPGQYTLFSSEAIKGHIMKMDVEAGKRYFVLVRPIYGYGFQLRPVKHKANNDFVYSNPAFDSWISTTVIHEKSDGSDQWHQHFQGEITKIKSETWKAWEAKSKEQQLELTLLPEDASQ